MQKDGPVKSETNEIANMVELKSTVPKPQEPRPNDLSLSNIASMSEMMESSQIEIPSRSDFEKYFSEANPQDKEL
jgi:hypothetical protein